MIVRAWAAVAIAILLFGVCYLQAPADAKTKTVSISGRAKDPSGAAIRNGVVTLLVSGETNETAKTYIRQDGRFTFASVPPRIYQLAIQVPGFNIFRTVVFAESGKKIKVGDLGVDVGYHGDDERDTTVVHDGIEYFGGGDGKIGYIVATDVATRKELWTVQLFGLPTHWWKGEAFDQRIFIFDLKLDQNVLVIETNRPPCYRLDLSTKRVNKDRCVPKP
jgi:hypothetical protein